MKHQPGLITKVLKHKMLKTTKKLRNLAEIVAKQNKLKELSITDLKKMEKIVKMKKDASPKTRLDISKDDSVVEATSVEKVQKSTKKSSGETKAAPKLVKKTEASPISAPTTGASTTAPYNRPEGSGGLPQTRPKRVTPIAKPAGIDPVTSLPMNMAENIKTMG